MTVNNCAKGTTGPCRDNQQTYVEPMKCERFHEDNSGPWYMISTATGHERCGEVKVNLYSPENRLLVFTFGFLGHVQSERSENATRVSGALHYAQSRDAPISHPDAVPQDRRHGGKREEACARMR